MFSTLGVPELLIILVLVLIVFGAGKLPKVMRSMGEGVKEFREASEDGLEGGDGDSDAGTKDAGTKDAGADSAGEAATSEAAATEKDD